MTWSLLIKNGTVVDGTGAPRFAADVAIEGDRIVAVAPDLVGEAERIIDARGFFVAPGFIDIHSHSDFFYPGCPSAESKLRQGVTTETVGMCSFSPAPVVPERRDYVEGIAAALGAAMTVQWESFGDYLGWLSAQPLGVNVVHFVGHGPLRVAAMGLENRAPTAIELDRMKGLLGEAIDAGAFGFSSGLIYPPSAFARQEELVEMCRSMAARGGTYFTHIRGEADTLLTAVDEAIAIAERGGVPLQIAHIKAFGRENWSLLDAALAAIEAARDRGVAATADVYPYDASSTVMTLLLPNWVHDGGTAKLLERLSDPAIRERILQENQLATGRWQTASGTIGWDEVLIATCPDSSCEGMTLEAFGRSREQPPAAAMLELLHKHDAAVSMVVFSQLESNVRKALSRPYVMIGSDSMGLSCGAGPHPGKPHPRTYGTFPRVLGKYVREVGLFSWEEAVAKMTGEPAVKLGLRARGLVRSGHFADLALFDPTAVKDEATYAEPHRSPSGIPFVIVNGAVVVDGGTMREPMAGRLLQQS